MFDINRHHISPSRGLLLGPLMSKNERCIVFQSRAPQSTVESTDPNQWKAASWIQVYKSGYLWNMLPTKHNSLICWRWVRFSSINWSPVPASTNKSAGSIYINKGKKSTRTNKKEPATTAIGVAWANPLLQAVSLFSKGRTQKFSNPSIIKLSKSMVCLKLLCWTVRLPRRAYYSSTRVKIRKQGKKHTRKKRNYSCLRLRMPDWFICFLKAIN